MMHKVLWQRKRNLLQNIWIFIGCLSEMLSFGTCNGNRGGFTICAVKNNLGIPVVVLISKRTRFELPLKCCGGHFRKQMYSTCMCLQDYYYARRRKNVSSVAVLTRDLELPRSNRKRGTRLGQSGWFLAIVQMERGKENLGKIFLAKALCFCIFLSSFIIIRIAVSFFV